MERPKGDIAIPKEVMDDFRLKARDKLMFGEMLTFGDENGCTEFTNSDWAYWYAVTKRSVIRSIGRLAECGYISKEYRYDVDNNEIRILKVRGDMVNEFRKFWADRYSGL